MSGAFNLQTGLICNNGQLPAVGTITSGVGGCANVSGIVSRNGGCSTDLPVVIGAGLTYTPAGTAGGVLAVSGAGSNTNMPIGCIIMYYSGIGTGFVADNAGVNGYYLVIGAEIWKSCDGTTGSIPATGSAFGATPNLVNTFARGIDTLTVPAVLPEAITINVAALTVNEIPQMTASSTNVSVSGTTSGPDNIAHTHNAPGGYQGFVMFDAGGVEGTENPASGSTTNATGTAVSTGGVGGGGGNLALHTHTFADAAGTSSAVIGTAVPGQPTAGGSSIKPTSMDVVYIIRVF